MADDDSSSGAPTRSDAAGDVMHELDDNVRGYWRANLQLIGVLMAAGFLFTFVGGYFAADFARMRLFGWPLPFLVAARCSLLLYVGIVCVYAWRMRTLDRRWTRRQPPSA
jgi:putative solute:sodium symporter small subunit